MFSLDPLVDWTHYNYQLVEERKAMLRTIGYLVVLAGGKVEIPDTVMYRDEYELVLSRSPVDMKTILEVHKP